MYETKRHIKRTGTASAPGHEAAEDRAAGQGHCPHTRRNTRGNLSVEEAVSAGRTSSSKGQSTSRGQAQADGPASSKAGPLTAERAQQTRLCHRTVDPEACGPGDSQALRRSVRSLRGLARATGYGLELSKARTPSPRTRRSSHPAVAKQGLAAYKKKPADTGLASFFRTKAALCSNRWSDVLGLLRGRRRFITVGTGGIVFRSSRPSPSPRNVGVWVCISIFSIITSLRMILSCLRKVCWVVCSGDLFWSWTAGRFIVPQPSALGRDFLSVCRSNGSQRMLRNSTRTNKCGLGLSTWIWRTTFQRTSANWVGPSGARSAGQVVNSLCCVRFSNMRNSNYR